MENDQVVQIHPQRFKNAILRLKIARVLGPSLVIFINVIVLFNPSYGKIATFSFLFFLWLGLGFLMFYIHKLKIILEEALDKQLSK